MDSQTFRATLAQFATGVTVVISGLNGAVHGMTVNSFCSVSLEPPLVLFCADNRSDTLLAVIQSRRFTVSILSDQHEHLSHRLALLGPQTDIFDTSPWGQGLEGIPFLKDGLAYLDCSVDNIVPAGDHHIIVGRVDHLARLKPGRPLLYYQSQYYHPATSQPD